MFGPYGPTLSEERLQRFREDRAVLAEVCPRLRHCIWMDGRGALAEGMIDIDIGAGCWESVDVLLEFGSDYPRNPPRVYDRCRRWRVEDDRHIMAGGEFCLWLARVDVPDVAKSAGLRLFLLRLLPFLRDQFVFDDLGHWPGPEWPHGPRAAYAQYLIERLRIVDPPMLTGLWPLVLGAPQRPDRACPCGSRLVYARCHQEDVQAVPWVRGLASRDELPTAIEERLRNAA